MPFFKYIAIAEPAILTLISLTEGFALSRRRKYDWKGWGISIADFSTIRVIQVFFTGMLPVAATAFAWKHRISTLSIKSWQAFPLLMLGQEFFYYWFHRVSHRMRFFWAGHLVHHSPNQLDLSVGLRTGVLRQFTGTQIFFAPLIWLGYPAEAVLFCIGLNMHYQFLIHSEWIPKLGWLEYVLNTPSAHRVHHAASAEYLDANYGGVLIIFDRLFGTYIPERGDPPCRYGLVHPQTSYNFLKVELAELQALAKDMVKSRSLRNALGYLFKPPGWRPDGPGKTTAELRKQIVSVK